MSGAGRSPAAAGYSGTPLWRKLGIAAEQRIVLAGTPPEFVIADLPPGVDVRRRVVGTFDLIVAFFTRRRDLEQRVPRLMASIHVDGSLWIAWPKRSAGIASDITEDTIREVTLPTGLVDNKVCAVNDTWSGLRLVLRGELRAGLSIWPADQLSATPSLAARRRCRRRPSRPPARRRRSPTSQGNT